MTNTLSYPQGATLPDPIVTLAASPQSGQIDATDADSIEVLVADQAGNVHFTIGAVTVVDAVTLTWSWATSGQVTELEPGLYPCAVRLHVGARYREIAGFVEILDSIG